MQFSIELDEQLLQRAKHRANEQGTDLSSILLEYLQHYAANTTFQTEEYTDNPLQRLLNSGLVGCAKGDPDLSTNYKAELRNILDEKM